jgi:hypothetical protein
VDHVASAEQLGGGRPHQHDVTREQSVEHQETQSNGPVVGNLEATGRQRIDPRHQLGARACDLIGRDPKPQLRVGSQYLDGALDGQPPSRRGAY